MEEKISVILVNYNGKQYNDACIDSILKSTVAPRIQVVVVDNASTDGSLEELEDRWGSDGRVHIIPLDENYGFSRANNEGIRWSIEQGIRYFLLLNNDTEIEPDTVGHMMDYHRKTGRIVVPKILYADRRDTIWCAGGSFTPVIRKAVQRGLNRKDGGKPGPRKRSYRNIAGQQTEEIDQISQNGRSHAQYSSSGRCQFANGCAIFLSREIVERVGYLDERFFLYYEDTEYSMRAAARGVEIGYCAAAVVYHKVNGSTGGNGKPANAYYITRNWLLCNSIHMRGKKHVNGRFLLFFIYFVCNRAAWFLIWLAQGKWGMCAAEAGGVRDFFCKKWGRRQ